MSTDLWSCSVELSATTEMVCSGQPYAARADNDENVVRGRRHLGQTDLAEPLLPRNFSLLSR